MHTHTARRTQAVHVQTSSGAVVVRACSVFEVEWGVGKADALSSLRRVRFLSHSFCLTLNCCTKVFVLLLLLLLWLVCCCLPLVDFQRPGLFFGYWVYKLGQVADSKVGQFITAMLFERLPRVGCRCCPVIFRP